MLNEGACNKLHSLASQNKQLTGEETQFFFLLYCRYCGDEGLKTIDKMAIINFVLNSLQNSQMLFITHPLL